MHLRIDAMYAAISRASNAIPSYLPASPANLDRPGQLDEIALQPIDACAMAVTGAIDTASEHPARLAMLGEEALLAALENNEIAQGSLAHIVVVHYLIALLDGLEAKRNSEALLQSISQGLATIGAALSLSALLASRIPAPQACLRTGTCTSQVQLSPASNTTRSPAPMRTGSPSSGVTVTSPSSSRQVSCSS